VVASDGIRGEYRHAALGSREHYWYSLPFWCAGPHNDCRSLLHDEAAERADWDMDDAALHRALAERLEGYARQTELSIFGVMPREAEVQKAKNTTVASFVATAKQLAKPHDSGLESVVAMNTLCEKVISSIEIVGSADAQFVVDLIRYRQTNVATKELTKRLVHPAFYYLDLYGSTD
jgi:hypothetical protein